MAKAVKTTEVEEIVTTGEMKIGKAAINLFRHIDSLPVDSEIVEEFKTTKKCGYFVLVDANDESKRYYSVDKVPFIGSLAGLKLCSQWTYTTVNVEYIEQLIKTYGLSIVVVESEKKPIGSSVDRTIKDLNTLLTITTESLEKATDETTIEKYKGLIAQINEKLDKANEEKKAKEEEENKPKGTRGNKKLTEEEKLERQMNMLSKKYLA